MNVAETVVGVQRDAHTPFERWAEDTVRLETVRFTIVRPQLAASA